MISVRFAFGALAMAILLLSLFGSRVSSAQEMPGAGWSSPKLLYEDRNGFSRVDKMIADISGAVHFFWAANPRSPYRDGTEYDENETAIFYQRLQVESDWLPSRDILLRSQAVMPFGAAVDSQGILHIMTTTGGAPCLAHLHVTVEQAGDPRAWRSPRCIESVGVGSPDLAVDANDGLYVIYTTPNQKEIAVVSSTDGGHSWSNPATVVSTVESNINLVAERIAVDAVGRLHAIWGEVQAPNGYPYLGLYYAHSLDGGSTWSDPFRLADANQGDANVAVFGDSIHAVWNGDAGYQGRYYRVSHDSGATWSERVTLPLPITSGGLQGAPAIIVDSTGMVHILYTDSPRLFYITQQDGVWSREVQIAGPENTGSANEINYPMLVLTEGNRMHASYTRDAQAMYYQDRKIDAPFEPSTVLPKLAMTAAGVTETQTPVVEGLAPVPTRVAMQTLPSVSLSGTSSILLVTLPVLVLVTGTLIFQLSRRRR